MRFPVAKMALIERELKRDKLVAKYAKKHAELKAASNDQKKIFLLSPFSASARARIPAYTFSNTRGTLQMKWG